MSCRRPAAPRALGALLLALLALAAPVAAQLNAPAAAKVLKKRGKAATKLALQQMKAAEASFKLKLRAFELDMFAEAAPEDALIDELATDLSDLQDAIHEAAQAARDDLVDEASELLGQLPGDDALPKGFAPGDGGALDTLREKLLAFAEKQRARLQGRLGRTRKLIDKATGLRLAFVLRPLDQVVSRVPGNGAPVELAGPPHRVHWLMGASRAQQGGRLLAGGTSDAGAPLPAPAVSGDAGVVATSVSAPEPGRWLLQAGDDPPLPRGNYLLQLAPDATSPGVSAGIGLR